MNDQKRDGPNDSPTSLVPVGRGSGTLQLSTAKYWTGIDMSSDEGKALYLRCKSNACVAYDAVKGKDIEIVNILCHEVEEVDDETGEARCWIRNVLVCGDGKLIAGGSQGIRNSLADLVQMYGSPPWNPPLAVKLTEGRTKNKRTVHFLELSA